MDTPGDIIEKFRRLVAPQVVDLGGRYLEQIRGHGSSEVVVQND